MGLFRIFMPKQLPADNCRQTTTTAEKSNYQKGKPDYPAAFVLVEDDTGVEMPVWAIKVVLEETALIEE